MTEPQHPLTPPPELVQQWIAQVWHEGTPVQVAASDLHVATRAAQWGAEAELNACCEWLTLTQGQWELAANLRAARRPKPPSLALEEALKRAAMVEELARSCGHDPDDTIRRALERLQELEDQQ